MENYTKKEFIDLLKGQFQYNIEGGNFYLITKTEQIYLTLPEIRCFNDIKEYKGNLNYDLNYCNIATNEKFKVKGKIKLHKELYKNINITNQDLLEVFVLRKIEHFSIDEEDLTIEEQRKNNVKNKLSHSVIVEIDPFSETPLKEQEKQQKQKGLKL